MTATKTKTRATKGSLWLALAAATGIIATTTPASATFDGRHHRGGFVKPCSLDGVNPVYHPDIFGNPRFAREVYGFIQGRDGSWQVMPGCNLYN